MSEVEVSIVDKRPAASRKLSRGSPNSSEAKAAGRTALEQSEVLRQRALGAQAELRTELEAYKEAQQALRDKLALESQRLEVANRVAAKAERDLTAVTKERDALESMSSNLRQDVARLGGMLDMLREIGAIPKQEPGRNGAMVSPRYPNEPGGWNR